MSSNPQGKKVISRLQAETQEYDMAILFGSYARGEAYSQSDVDVLLLDSMFEEWIVIEPSEQQELIQWDDSLPPLHIVCSTKKEFATRYAHNESMALNVAEDGYSINADFAFTDFVSDIN